MININNKILTITYAFFGEFTLRVEAANSSVTMYKKFIVQYSIFDKSKYQNL